MLTAIAARIPNHQLTAPMMAATIITGQMTPASVLHTVSATDGGGVAVAGIITEPTDTASSVNEASGLLSSVKFGCFHCGSDWLLDCVLVTDSW